MCDAGGWVKTYRKLTKWQWYDSPLTAKIFNHCILVANHKEGFWRGLTIPRGSLVTSYEKLALENGMSIQQTRTAINNLISTGEITKQSTSKYTIISVSNYDTYQSMENAEQQTNNIQITNKQQTNNKQITTNKNVKKNKNDKNVKEEKNIPEIEISGDKKPSYIQILYNVFTEEYRRVRGYDFDTDTIKKEESAIGKLAQGFKQRNPDKTTDEAIAFFTDYFKKCLRIEHEFLKRTMSPSLILSQKTQINTIIKEGNYATTKPATNGRNDRLTIQQLTNSYERSKATIYADATKHSRNYRTPDVREQSE